ncbi:hypothetical protein MON38_08355 [Hymenobacter sp. DH14]|uniref:Carboxypeptidase regulatory-like domain-containing protein n=1 Tax=Hymenobacter cyanobacteriorum TaxID=2926463 RepID=A0A9X1VI80_9BACT|nr:hypothetical protein [Hymenobacter cyanobacteriorum]MCI1187430.1 hypothetical protein [Hymenobacter cyanobacteriorum]
MKSLVRTWALLALAGLPLFATTVSCSKKQDDPTPPAIAVGTVDGTITPVGSINYAQLTLPGETNGVLAAPDVQGYFKFSNVAAGNYNLSFQAASGYIAPSPRTITVAAGSTTSVGSITVNQSGPSSVALHGTATWMRDNTAYTSTTIGGTVTLTNGTPSSFNLLATAQNGGAAEIVGLNIPYFSGTGLYRLENVQFSGNATYVRTSGGIPFGSFRTSGYSGLLGTVTVATVNTTARTITGTFGYTAYDPQGSAASGTDRVYVSNGTFSLSY